MNLLSTEYKIIGTAITITEQLLHGHNIPDGYIKAAIQKITAGVPPWPDVEGGPVLPCTILCCLCMPELVYPTSIICLAYIIHGQVPKAEYPWIP